jgi:hypothetical protein
LDLDLDLKLKLPDGGVFDLRGHFCPQIAKSIQTWCHKRPLVSP